MTAALQRRLYGGPNRIEWSPADVQRLCAHPGVDPKVVQLSNQVREAAQMKLSATKAADDGRSYVFTISTANVDRMGDTIAVTGWRTANYLRNPVVLWGHDAMLLPVGKGGVWIEGSALKGRVTFAPTDAGREVREPVKGCFLKATSVGFRPLKWQFSKDPARKDHMGIDFIEQELLEFSSVTVPANAEATLAPGQTGKAMTPFEWQQHQREHTRAARQRTLDLLSLKAARHDRSTGQTDF